MTNVYQRSLQEQYEYDTRLGLKLIYEDLHGHHPEYDVDIMPIEDVRELYNELWDEYKSRAVHRAVSR